MPEETPSPENRSLPRLGSYQILRQLGSGGMSNVFQAIHAESGSLVALKVLPRKLAQNAVLLQRFLREAKSAENLDHPNIVAIYDRGFDQGRHYLVLEYVEGKDLYDRVRADGPFPTSQAVALVREIAQGLQYALKQGMIHRDVKPANLLISADGHAKIIDLGLALMTDDEDERVTRDGTTVGTVDYMSPEQARDSRKINERSDIYSLGCTLFYLVTGKPPFAGGNLADKLARHHSAEIPDVRSLKPEIPADFALLIQKMMAKKPEQRFGDYEGLINALDRIGSDPQPPAPAQRPDVLIDDAEDEDDDEGDYLELTLAGPVATSPPPPAKPPTASRRPGSASGGGPAADGGAPEISLAELAALDSDENAIAGKGQRRRAGASTPKSSVIVDALLEEEDAAESTSMRRSSDELPLQTWIFAGVGVGFLIAVVGFGVHFALSFLKTSDDSIIASQPESGQSGRQDESGTTSVASNESATYSARSATAGPINPPRKPFELVGPIPPAVPRVVIPERSTTETAYSAALVSRLGMANDGVVAAVEAPGKVIVRRLADSNDPTQTISIANAFGRANEDVELADVGPFHEDDCQVAGKSRIIRGRGGVRPVLKIEAASQKILRDQEAKFLLGLNGIERLVIEGIDLVVDVRDLPSTQSTLFLCQGVDLTLRDCSITIANAEDRKNGFAVFRLTNGPRMNRLRIERSLIRGPIQTLAHLASGSAEVTLDRTIVAGSGDSLIQIESADRADRSLKISRSVLVNRGSIFTWSGKPTSTSIRSLGTTYARVESLTPAPLMTARAAVPTGIATWLDYDGEANRWCGWSSLAQWSGGPASSGSVGQNLRGIWSSADLASQEVPAGWPGSSIAEAVTALDYADLIPAASATLELVAAPQPHLLELTVDLFARLPTPDLADDLASESFAAPKRPTVSLTFDAQPNQRTDLGLFLKEQILDASKRYVVRIQGTGNQLMSPVRLPDGVSVALLGPAGGGSANPVPVFTTARAGFALIELHGGDLALANLGFATDGSTRTRHWIYAEDSLLAVRRCRYRDLGPVADQSGLAAIAFVAPRTEPIPPRTGGFKAASNRPTAALADCWIWTTADAISVELGRGVVALENCLIEAGNAAFRLKPSSSRLASLEGDLILENCTVIDDRYGVQLEATPDGSALAGRPWLIVSRASVFPRSWQEGGALIGVDPATFAQGALFWQSSNDLYEVSRFLAPISGAGSGLTLAADLKRQWIDLWGMNHTRGDRGPEARKADRVLHFRDKDRSRTTRPTPLQLELDPKLHGSQGVNFKSLPPIPRS